MTELVEKTIKRAWHAGRQKRIYVLRETPYMSPL